MTLKRKINRIEVYLDMIRQAGMVPGLSAHMPEFIEYTDENKYDAETYTQIFNTAGKRVDYQHFEIFSRNFMLFA